MEIQIKYFQCTILRTSVRYDELSPLVLMTTLNYLYVSFAGPTLNDKQMVIATGSGDALAIKLPSEKARDLLVAKLHRLCLDEQSKFSGSNMISAEPLRLTSDGGREM